MARSIWDWLLERKVPYHVHACPECYEHLPCFDDCYIEDDLEHDDGTPCGWHFVCDECAPVVRLSG